MKYIRRPTRKFIIAVALGLAIFSSAAPAQVKQWTDEKGVTHFDSEPPKPVQPKPLEIRIRKAKPFTLAALASNSEMRKASESYLAELASSLMEAQLQMAILETTARTEMIGRSGDYLRRTQFQWSQAIGDTKAKMDAPIRSDLLSMERVIKERNAGALPDWLKDNRDWRALDKEFQR